jgi:RNA polymerase sigma factor (sigma-70 family)
MLLWLDLGCSGFGRRQRRPVNKGAVVATQGGDDPPAVIESFVAGDEAALAKIYTRWSTLVYSVALSSLGNVADAEEVTQRVFTQAWASRDTFDRVRGKVPAWLIEITRHELSDAHAARSKQAQVRRQGATLTQGRDEIEPSDLADRLVVADEMSRLAAIPQQAIRLALSEGLTHTQIAERTGLPADLVKSHLGDGLLKLRERLAVLHGAY